MADLKVAIAGAGGRMGMANIRAITAAPGIYVNSAFDRRGAEAIGKDAGLISGIEALDVIVTDDVEHAISGSDAIIDFTAPAASVALANVAAQFGLVHIIGTTGLSGADEAALQQAGQNGARIVKSGNFSPGMVMLASLVRQAAAALTDYDIEIVEMHHEQEGRRSIRHRPDARRGGSGRSRCAAFDPFRPLARRPYRCEKTRHDRLRRTARRHRGGRSLGDLRRPIGAHRTHAPGRGPHHLRQRRRSRSALGAGPEAGLLLDGRRAGHRRMTARAYWIGVAAKDHVDKGVAGGFCMFAHGKHSAVQRLNPADLFCYYAPMTGMGAGEVVRAFTAIGEILDRPAEQHAMAPEVTGWRRAAHYFRAHDADIYPLLPLLSFVSDRSHWGMYFRKSLFKIDRDDFSLIAHAMGAAKVLELL